MRADRSFEPSGFVVLRTPLLPLDTLEQLSHDLEAAGTPVDGDLDAAVERDRARTIDRLRRLVADPVIREAVFVASPSAHEAVSAWVAEPANRRAKGVVDLLVRYIARMSARPTPFGLFSGCTLGGVARETRLELGPRSSYRRYTRIDVDWLSRVCARLSESPALVDVMHVRPNETLYAVDSQLRFVASRGPSAYEFASLPRSEYIDTVLRRAADGASIPELVDDVLATDSTISREEATGFVRELCHARVLVSDLRPAVTGEEPTRSVLSVLREHVEARKAVAALTQAVEALAALDAEPLGSSPASYESAAAPLLDLEPGSAEVGRVLRVDMYKPAKVLQLGDDVIGALVEAVRLLCRVAPTRNAALDRFKASFVERYGTATVPLTEAIDADFGVGFPVGADAIVDPRLDLIDVPGSSRTCEFSARDEHLLARVVRTTRERAIEWALDDEDVEALSRPKPLRLPDAFAVFASIVGRSSEARSIVVDGIRGPSGATLLGRFCHGDPALRRAVEAHLAAEEAMVPEAIFAEIIHLSEGGASSVSSRPTFRGWEIPYHGRGSVEPARRIPVSDLAVRVVDTRIVVSSIQHGREVVPRLSTAEAWWNTPLPIYAFLCAVQNEEAVRHVAWSWGAVTSAPFLPRVVRGRVILSCASWQLSRRQLDDLAERSAGNRYRAVRRLRDELSLPRHVSVADGKRLLPVDLENVVELDSFLRFGRDQSGVRVIERLPQQNGPRGPEGRFANEIVVPFIATTTRRRPPRVRESVRSAAESSGEWGCVKLYVNDGAADDVLREVVGPLASRARWFFARDSDPHGHLCVYFQSKRGTRPSQRAFDATADAVLRDRRIWRVQIEKPRVGPSRFVAAASVVDTQTVIEILELLDDDVSRRHVALRGIHQLWSDLGLDLSARRDLAIRMYARLTALVSDTTHEERKRAATFRAERAAIEALVRTDPGATHPLAGVLRCFAKRSRRIRRLSRVFASPADAAEELALAHTNRVFHRVGAHETLMVIDFVRRAYESESKRR